VQVDDVARVELERRHEVRLDDVQVGRRLGVLGPVPARPASRRHWTAVNTTAATTSA